MTSYPDVNNLSDILHTVKQRVDASDSAISSRVDDILADVADITTALTDKANIYVRLAQGITTGNNIQGMHLMPVEPFVYYADWKLTATDGGTIERTDNSLVHTTQNGTVYIIVDEGEVKYADYVLVEPFHIDIIEGNFTNVNLFYRWFDLKDFDQRIGLVSELLTADKSSVVHAINSLKNYVDGIIESSEVADSPFASYADFLAGSGASPVAGKYAYVTFTGTDTKPAGGRWEEIATGETWRLDSSDTAWLPTSNMTASTTATVTDAAATDALKVAGNDTVTAWLQAYRNNLKFLLTAITGKQDKLPAIPNEAGERTYFLASVGGSAAGATPAWDSLLSFTRYKNLPNTGTFVANLNTETMTDVNRNNSILFRSLYTKSDLPSGIAYPIVGWAVSTSGGQNLVGTLVDNVQRQWNFRISGLDTTPTLTIQEVARQTDVSSISTALTAEIAENKLRSGAVYVGSPSVTASTYTYHLFGTISRAAKGSDNARAITLFCKYCYGGGANYDSSFILSLPTTWVAETQANLIANAKVIEIGTTSPHIAVYVYLNTDTNVWEFYVRNPNITNNTGARITTQVINPDPDNFRSDWVGKTGTLAAVTLPAGAAAIGHYNGLMKQDVVNRADINHSIWTPASRTMQYWGKGKFTGWSTVVNTPITIFKGKYYDQTWTSAEGFNGVFLKVTMPQTGTYFVQAGYTRSSDSVISGFQCGVTPLAQFLNRTPPKFAVRKLTNDADGYDYEIVMVKANNDWCVIEVVMADQVMPTDDIFFQTSANASVPTGTEAVTDSAMAQALQVDGVFRKAKYIGARTLAAGAIYNMPYPSGVGSDNLISMLGYNAGGKTSFVIDSFNQNGANIVNPGTASISIPATAMVIFLASHRSYSSSYIEAASA